jgi:hypothetical protein
VFSVKQTRLILLLSVIITFLICFIGLNWRSGEEKKSEMVAILKVPKIENGDTAARKKFEEVKKEFPGAIRDEGKAISLD